MAGTYALNLFDRFHLGHQALIDRLSDMPNPVAVVTGGEIVGRDLELQCIIQPIEERLARLKEYLADKELDSSITATTMTLFDEVLSIDGATTFLMYQGPCCDDVRSSALDKRTRYDDVLDYPRPVRAYDGNKLTSARVRRGEIDREGKKLRGTKEPPRRLDFLQRDDLKSPKGDLYHEKDGPPEERVASRIADENPKCVIAVGDVTTATLLEQDYVPDVSIVDGITKRGKFEGTFTGEQEYKFYNPAAVLFPEAWSTIDTAIRDKKKSLLVVDGEEDLMGFPGVLLAPKRSVMLYGQPNAGIVWVPVNKENKSLARALLDKMPIIC
ncbi:MAG: DUF359 domain-containing protein [Candidatus Thorarchaeota archaeon]|jgi:uncharacterized protein (UPF0218 family)/phosphopantetheine adenylyltransferase